MSEGTLPELIVGGVVSCTLTVNDPVAVFECESVALQVTVVVVIGNVTPDAGEQFTSTRAGNGVRRRGLRVRDGGTGDRRRLGVNGPGMPENTGSVVSTTVTVKTPG